MTAPGSSGAQHKELSKVTTITVSLVTLSDEALSGLTYHPEAAIRLAAQNEIKRRNRK